jgi:hypothetical protein
VQFLYPRFSLLTKTLRLLCDWRGGDFLIRIFRESQGKKPLLHVLATRLQLFLDAVKNLPRRSEVRPWIAKYLL